MHLSPSPACLQCTITVSLPSHALIVRLTYDIWSILTRVIQFTFALKSPAPSADNSCQAPLDSESHHCTPIQEGVCKVVTCSKMLGLMLMLECEARCRQRAREGDGDDGAAVCRGREHKQGPQRARQRHRRALRGRRPQTHPLPRLQAHPPAPGNTPDCTHFYTSPLHATELHVLNPSSDRIR